MSTVKKIDQKEYLKRYLSNDKDKKKKKKKKDKSAGKSKYVPKKKNAFQSAPEFKPRQPPLVSA